MCLSYRWGDTCLLQFYYVKKWFIDRIVRVQVPVGSVTRCSTFIFISCPTFWLDRKVQLGIHPASCQTSECSQVSQVQVDMWASLLSNEQTKMGTPHSKFSCSTDRRYWPEVCCCCWIRGRKSFLSMSHFVSDRTCSDSPVTVFWWETVNGDK